jgi:ComF family protein
MDFSQIKNFVWDLLFPTVCLGCGRDGCYLCLDCAGKLPRIETQKCLSCQTASPFGRTHPDCGKLKVDGIISALHYSDPLAKKLIKIFKYRFVDLSAVLHLILLEALDNQELRDFLKTFIIVPVPLHPRRFKWRGFNQSELLARQLERILQIPCRPDYVKRIRFTTPQVLLSKAERQKNIIGAFEASSAAGKNFLVVDDVVTTGATINEIAKTLKRKKAQNVWALTLAAD